MALTVAMGKTEMSRVSVVLGLFVMAVVVVAQRDILIVAGMVAVFRLLVLPGLGVEAEAEAEAA